MIGKTWVVNEEHNFFIRSYRSEIKKECGGDDHRKLREEAKKRLVWGVKKRTQWGVSTEHKDSKLIKWNRCIGNNELMNSRRQILKGGQAISTTKKESQARKWTEEWYEICKVRVVICIKSNISLIISYHCIRHWNPTLLG